MMADLPEKETEVLRQQIEKLYVKDFDLKAWKNKTMILLERIFGPNNLKIKAINDIEYDFSSWSLRDATGKSSNLDQCRKEGRDVLEAAIMELESFGAPTREVDTSLNVSIIQKALEEELKLSQYREVTGIIQSDLPDEEKKSKLKDFIIKAGTGTVEDILINILSNPALQNKFE